MIRCLYQLAPQRTIAAGPIAFAILLRLVLCVHAFQFGVELIQVMDSQSFRKHGLLRRAEFKLAVMGEDNVLNLVFERKREFRMARILSRTISSAITICPSNCPRVE